ncbi:rhodanese-like domain-containing protein [Xylanimonas protaetiae]|uniref:Rhodanese-like domain-containing protein n=1 Tax=Xylanimonas protaetiae TaxID=2509457 RepID=A0A4P6F5F9_9MICO|nr:rhodanese-like domain-containing protein [Xylanimonas protaetiae]
MNLDVNAADFAEQAARLDQSSPLVIYCRSGARAVTAVRHLRSAGFADVVNAGSVTAASRATGLAVVVAD